MANLDEARSIVKNVGGPSNIKSVTHCATRLRFIVKDTSLVNGDAIEKNPDVIKFLESGGQEQVVIGPKVDDVYNWVLQILGKDFQKKTETSDSHIIDKSENKNPFEKCINKVFAVLQGTFTPILPVLAGVGLVKALAITITGFSWMTDKAPTIMVLNGIYNAFFYYLPIILSVSMARYFKVDMFIASTIGAALLEPTMIMKLIGQKGVNFFGIPFSMQNYSTTVFPVLIAIPIYAWLYKFLTKHIGNKWRTLIIPFACFMIMIPFVMIVIGPIAVALGNGLANLIVSLFHSVPLLAGAIMGATWEILVLFGLHWAIIPICIANIAHFGSDPIISSAGVSGWACLGIALGILIKAKKDPKLRSVMAAAIIPFLFAGITEPIVYGALLRYKKCLAFTIITGGIGGALIALVGERARAMFFSVVALQTSINWIPGTIVGIGVTILAFVAVLIWGYESKSKAKTTK